MGSDVCTSRTECHKNSTMPVVGSALASHDVQPSQMTIEAVEKVLNDQPLVPIRMLVMLSLYM